MLINEKKIIKTVHNVYGVCKNNKETNKQTLKILLKSFCPIFICEKKEPSVYPMTRSLWFLFISQVLRSKQNKFIFPAIFSSIPR